MSHPLDASELVQGSAEWHAIRCGRVTASRIADVVAKTKSGWGANRKNYAAELIAERLTGIAAQSYVNAAMQFGIDMEPEARSAYEFMTDNTVTEVGFVKHPAIPMAGASPDGCVGDSGLVEIKVPNTSTHIATLLYGKIDNRYDLQMQFQLACTGRDYCDFVSYDPRMPASMQLFIKRVKRNDDQIKGLERAVTEFLAEISVTVAELEEKYEKDAA